jgi:hypothetical protein
MSPVRHPSLVVLESIPPYCVAAMRKQTFNNRMSMGVPHPHMRESMESISDIFVYFSRGLFSSSVRQFLPYPDVSFLHLPPFIDAIFNRELSS